ncbi:MAG: BREX-1 system adenine-specific DNA-methyltransferase PglX [Acidobacteria bacterium]|nr:BREX-1 system adenine-specific DNA-methyltransferase PglX [Acidobacteriota bacterium]
MAFDQTTRNRLQKFVSEARKVLTEEFTRQLQSIYGIDPESASISPLDRLQNLDDARRETAKILRATLDHYRTTNPTEDTKSLLDRIVREHAFTILNRLAALRMAEARGLLIESLAQGYNSKGFQLYARVAGTGLGEKGDAYRCYLLSLFDEFALDLRVLFDRFSPTGRLFPREAALLEVLALMNDAEVAPLWAEDETIGWIYQYFNSKEERKKMRDESAAPRNSRELAVRNQFFTPRYVVEFLTDNTLGRIWYEMTKGETRLKDQCRYLVRRPTEIFLKPSEEAPPTEESAEQNLSQEELLKQPVYIPHRPLKDPRAIRVLDPACGSMHFGLYAFDLLAVIYDEAWELEAALDGVDWQREPGDQPLRETYADKEALLRDVPRLIIERNLHGIDIDPRAVQIAGLSLWLRAQRAWQQQGLKPADRPQVRRSNIVCAEPMPGEEALLNEFIERHLSATPELRLVAQLVRRVFRAMKLAGEAGSLLKIEEEVAGAVAEAKAQWQDETKTEQRQGSLFGDLAKHEQQRLAFEVAEITDETFWERAEGSIYKALREYAEQAENGGGYQRRLFAEDAARGFAFIDVCRKLYDVVLMNPPFGAFSKAWKAQANAAYPNSANDIFASFVEGFLHRLVSSGVLGAITSRTGFFITSFTDWRQKVLNKEARLLCFSDFGGGVMDNATVEAAAYVLQRSQSSDSLNTTSPFLRLLVQRDKQPWLAKAIESIQAGSNQEKIVYWAGYKQFASLPDAPFVYWAKSETLRKLSKWPSFEPNAAQVRKGLRTGDNFRFVRALWEIPQAAFTPGISHKESAERRELSKWVPLVLSGSSQPWFSPLLVALNWSRNGRELRQYVTKYGSPSRLIQAEDFYFRPGMSWTRRAARFIPYAIPQGCIPTGSRPMAFPNDGNQFVSLAISASRTASAFMRFYGDWFTRPNFLEGKVKLFPWPEITQHLSTRLDDFVRKESEQRRNEYQGHEPFFEYVKPFSISLEDQNNAVSLDWASLLGIDFESQIESCFGLDHAEALELHHELEEALVARMNLSEAEEEDEEGDDDESAELVLNKSERGQRELTVSHVLGCAFGRWDICFATGEKRAPDLSDPFAPLPRCPPGMLQNEQGLPAAPSDVPSNYPLRISWPGILVDDKGHAEDIERRIREALQVIWQDRFDAIEQEACEILGVKTLRDYFRKSAGFFADHLQRYSKSRRQAPIYWPLSTKSGGYTLWLYYHRLNDQTLYSCVNNFIEPKLKNEITPLVNGLRAKGANRSRDEDKEFERLQDFELELQELRDELLRLAQLPWRPNLNDGVQITAAPLWSLFRLPKWQKTLKETWGTLEKGDYDWAHLAMTIWPARIVPKCTKDRSLAIAHDLEDLFWVEDVSGWRALQSPQQEIKTQIERQRSTARDRVRQLLAEFAQGNTISATDIGDQLAAGAFDDRELTLLLYPTRMAEVVWESPVLAQRLNVKLPPKKTKAAREKFIKEIVNKGCGEVGTMLEAALSGRAKSFAEVWAELERGDHDDLALALALWPERVVEKCTKDVTMAETQGLRKFFWVQHPSDEWRKRISIEEEITNEVARRRGVPTSA